MGSESIVLKHVHYPILLGFAKGGSKNYGSFKGGLDGRYNHFLSVDATFKKCLKNAQSNYFNFRKLKMALDKNVFKLCQKLHLTPLNKIR